jgi:hypothetical protein
VVDMDRPVRRTDRLQPELVMRTPLNSEPVLDWGTVFGLFGWSSLFVLLLAGFVAFSLNV